MYKCNVCNLDFTKYCTSEEQGNKYFAENSNKCRVCSLPFSRSIQVEDWKPTDRIEKSDSCVDHMAQSAFLHSDFEKQKEKTPWNCGLSDLGLALTSHFPKHKQIPGEPNLCKYATSTCSGPHSNESGQLHVERKPFISDISGLQFAHCKTYSSDVHQSNRIKLVPNKSQSVHMSFTEFESSQKSEIQQKMKEPYTSDAGSASLVHTMALETHKRIGTGEKPKHCDLCSVNIAERNNIHKITEPGEKTYKCDGCSVGFAQANSLQGHKKQTREKLYKCDVCGVGFTHSHSLQRHKRTYTGEKPYKCDVCGIGFAHAHSLQRHKRTHTGEKPYKCEVCGVWFAHTHSLQRHKRTHTGEKPYKCDVCGVWFAHTHSLQRHKRTHTGEKPYKCDVCGIGFAHTHSLQRHKRTHTGEKPYKCEVCGVCFAHSNSLQMHKRTHTGESLANVFVV